MSCPHAVAANHAVAADDAEAGAGLFRLWADELPDSDVIEVDGFWLVRRHELIRAVFDDPITFSPDNALDAVTPLSSAALRALADHGFRLPPTLANNATATHPALRRVVAEAIAPARVSAQLGWLTGQTRRLVARSVARLRGGEVVDLHADLARDLPLLLLLRLLGLPWQSEKSAIRAMSGAALELFWAPLDPDRQLEVSDAVGRWHLWLRRRAAAGEGLAGQLAAHAERAGLDQDEALGALFFLLVAGHATTSQFLTLMMRRLLVSSASVSEPAAAIVEECLRLDAPIVSWRRRTTRQVRLGSAIVPAGADVVLDLAAAGREDSVFGLDAGWFRPGRDGAGRHLAFGRGGHSCPGAGLARVEARVFLTEVLPLLRKVRLVGEVSYSDNLSFRIPNSLVVSF